MVYCHQMKLEREKWMRYGALTLTALIVLLSGIQYVLRMCINNIGGTLPYVFCW